MRGDLAVTGASGAALDVIERRSRRVAAPLTVTPPAPLRGAGSRRDRGRARAAGSGPRGPSRPPPGGQRGRRRRHAGRARSGGDRPRSRRGAARRLRRGSLAGAAGAARGRRGGKCCWTAPTTRPGPRPSPKRSTTWPRSCAPGRPTLVLAIMADKDVDGVLGALAGAALLRGGAGHLHRPGGRPGAAAGTAGGALGGRGRADAAAGLSGAGRPGTAEAMADPRAALDAALAPRLRQRPGDRGGSLYLVGAARAMLVDDPRLVPDPTTREHLGGRAR